MVLTIGSDPEGFLVQNGVFIPALGLVGGDKNKPIKVKDGFAVLEDNVMVEFNIPPSDNGINLKSDISYMVEHIKTDILKGKYDLSFIPSVDFTDEQLNHPKAREFGCAVDYDVWTEMPRSLATNKTNRRFGGGHVHFGYPNSDIDMSIKMVKLCDLFMLVPSVLYDSDNERRKMYGQPGAFRFTDYGFEYRSLSNFWVNKYEDMIVNQIQQIKDNINLDVDSEKNNINEVIRNNNIELAQELIYKYNIWTI